MPTIKTVPSGEKYGLGKEARKVRGSLMKRKRKRDLPRGTISGKSPRQRGRAFEHDAEGFSAVGVVNLRGHRWGKSV